MALSNIDAITFGTKADIYVPTLYEGQPPKFTLGSAEESLHAPFGISTPYSGSDTTNLTCDIEVDAELAQQIGALDEAVVQAAIRNAEEWFGRPMNEMHLSQVHLNCLTPFHKNVSLGDFLPLTLASSSRAEGNMVKLPKSLSRYFFLTPDS